MAVAPDGEVFMRARQGALDVEGIVGIKNGVCRVVSAYSSSMPDEHNVGSGPSIRDYSGWLIWHEGRILAVQYSRQLLSIDATTGDRTIVSSTESGVLIGEGDTEIGTNYAALSAEGTHLYTTGPHLDRGVVRVDLATGERIFYPERSGPNGYGAKHGPIFSHPTLKGVLVIAAPGWVLLFDPTSGNSINLSN